MYKLYTILSQNSKFYTPSIQPRLIAVKNTLKQKKPKECWSRLEWRINAANGYYKEHMYICLWYSNLLKLKERRRLVHQKHLQKPFIENILKSYSFCKGFRWSMNTFGINFPFDVDILEFFTSTEGHICHSCIFLAFELVTPMDDNLWVCWNSCALKKC